MNSYKKTRKNNTHLGGGGNAQMDLQSLSQQDVEALMQQGIMPEQIAQLAQEQGQPIPPIIQQMMSADGAMPPDMGMMGGPPGQEGMPPPPNKTSKIPSNDGFADICAI